MVPNLMKDALLCSSRAGRRSLTLLSHQCLNDAFVPVAYVKVLIGRTMCKLVVCRNALESRDAGWPLHLSIAGALSFRRGCRASELDIGSLAHSHSLALHSNDRAWRPLV